MKRTIFTILAVFIVFAASAQDSISGYHIGKNFVTYNDSLMSDADAATFTIMDHGYAKDSKHFYHNGTIVELEKPKQQSESDKPSLLDIVLGTDEGTNHYSVNDGKVDYNGKEIKKADAATFKYIGGEYAADKHHAYYKGQILGDAWGIGQFTYKGNGYASDGVHWYCNGKPVDRD